MQGVRPAPGVSVLWLLSLILLCLAVQSLAAEEIVCRRKDLERLGKPGRWIIAPSCTTLDLSNFMVDDVEIGGMLDAEGKLYTSDSILTALLQSFELSWGGGAHIAVLDLSGCGIHDSDVPLLLNVLSENTHTARVNAHHAARNPRSTKSKRFTLLSSLHTLRLDNNHLSDAGMYALAKALGIATSQTSQAPSGSRQVHPPQTGAAVGGIIAPQEWLAGNLNKLHKLSLQRNRIGVSGVSALLKIFASASHGQVAPGLKELDLRVNPAWADKSFIAATLALATPKPATQQQGRSRDGGRTAAQESAENGLLWWVATHSPSKSALSLPGRHIVFNTGPHKNIVLAADAARAGGGSGSGTGRSSGLVTADSVRVRADGHMTLDRARISISIKRALDEVEEERAEQAMLQKMQLHYEKVLSAGARGSRRITKLTDMVSGASERGDAIVTAAEYEEHVASTQGTDHVPVNDAGAALLDEDDVGNTRVQQKRRQRDDAHMVDLLSQCFAGVTSEKNIHAISASLRQLGHPTPRSLLMVDVEDIAQRLSMIDSVYQRLLLRCLCDYNYYYEEAVTARRTASSLDHLDEQSPHLADEERARQLDDHRVRNGLKPVNRQTQKRLHADVWGWGEADAVSSNSVHSYADVPEESRSRGERNLGGAEGPGPQVTMYRRSYSSHLGPGKGEHAYPDLDLTGTAGLLAGSAVRLCESQYFRKSHIALRRAKRGSSSGGGGDEL